MTFGCASKAVRTAVAEWVNVLSGQGGAVCRHHSASGCGDTGGHC